MQNNQETTMKTKETYKTRPKTMKLNLHDVHLHTRLCRLIYIICSTLILKADFLSLFSKSQCLTMFCLLAAPKWTKRWLQPVLFDHVFKHDAVPLEYKSTQYYWVIIYNFICTKTKMAVGNDVIGQRRERFCNSVICLYIYHLSYFM